MKLQKPKVVAASFALRFGWSSGVVFGPFLINGSVADVRLNNLSLKFTECNLFEKAALHKLQIYVGKDCSMTPMQQLQSVLMDQAEPVVEALHQWSRLSRRAIWGQIASSWGAQCAQLLQTLGRIDETENLLQEFFDQPRLPAKTIPRFYPVSGNGHRRYYHERASCCLYFKVVDGHFCASCPVIDDDERLQRNYEWLIKTISTEKIQ